MAWDQMVANDQFANSCFFMIKKESIVPAMRRIILSTPALIREPVLAPVVSGKFAQSILSLA
jgi:hypothetical protein